MSMGKEEIIDRIKAEDFPQGSYVVFGSGPLAAAGIRNTDDIDLVVSDKLYRILQFKGWRFAEDPAGGPQPMLANGVFEVSRGWSFGPYNPNFEKLIASADIVKGIPFVNLNEVRKWKEQSARPKDLKDLKLIDDYFASHSSTELTNNR